MGNASQGQAKTKEDGKNHPGSSHHNKAEGLGKLYQPGFKVLREKCSCCKMCLRVLFVILALIVVVKSVVVMAVAVSTAYAIKIYSTDLSGRLVAMIVLAVTAAVSLSITLYAIVATCKRHPKALHAASLVLIILAVIQAIIAGVAVKVTPEDEVKLSRAMAESFGLARDDNPRHHKIWATTQHELNCCGVYGPEDYRTPNLPIYFSPDVPVSCCPSYDPDRSELVQERNREICKAKKEFYEMGCKNIVVEVFKETAMLVLSCTIALIVLEVFLSIIGSILSKEKQLLVLVEDGERKVKAAAAAAEKSKVDAK